MTYLVSEAILKYVRQSTITLPIAYYQWLPKSEVLEKENYS